MKNERERKWKRSFGKCSEKWLSLVVSEEFIMPLKTFSFGKRKILYGWIEKKLFGRDKITGGTFVEGEICSVSFKLT